MWMKALASNSNWKQPFCTRREWRKEEAENNICRYFESCHHQADPIYHSKTQKATSFYIRRYDKDGFALDATLQNLLNWESCSVSGATSSIVAI